MWPWLGRPVASSGSEGIRNRAPSGLPSPLPSDQRCQRVGMCRPGAGKKRCHHLRRHVFDACWVPLRRVVLVHRQGADALHGLALAGAQVEAMAPNNLLVVEDMHRDDRFQNNPLVTQAPNIRFYAGAPLVNLDGYALGTIAVADIKPRRFSKEEGEMLRDFSKLVISTLESRNNARRLQALALTDHLTGLPNRTHFERVLHLQMAHSSRTGEPFTLFYMDLNQFKMVNDTYGHAAGDEVLARVAHVMQSQLRAGDLLARLGGDEFGMIVRGGMDETAEPLAKRISEVVAKPMMLSNGKQVSIGVSIGSVAYSDVMSSMDKIMALADKALYENKRN